MGNRLQVSAVALFGLITCLPLRGAAEESAPGGGERTTTTAACGGATQLTLSASLTTIPAMSFPSGSCDTPDAVLPVEVTAEVVDGGGAPVAGCSVIFLLEFTSSCARGFGELCAGNNVAITDAAGRGSVLFAVTSADLNFCNCLDHDAGCPLCPFICWPACDDSGDDHFCEVRIDAATGDLEASAPVVIGYGG